MRSLDSGSPELPGMRSGWESIVAATLGRLGVPVEPEIRDRDTAAAHGFAAASVVLGHRALEGGRPEEAVTAFDCAILALQGRRHVSLGPFLAVVHYLRGSAYEARGLRVRALDDYAMALALTPDHSGALAGLDRLKGCRAEP